MNALYLKDLADKTRRGLEGRVRGRPLRRRQLCYGYDVVPGEERGSLTGDDDQPRRGGDRPPHLRGVRRRPVAEGDRARLNDEGVPGPTRQSSGGTTAIRGTPAARHRHPQQRALHRAAGLEPAALRQGPGNGRRVSRLNPPEAWIIEEVPELRIVDDALWERVKARQQALHKVHAFHERQRPRKLFSFLLRCGECGGGFSKVSQEHYGCSNARNKGTCGNRVTDTPGRGRGHGRLERCKPA